MQASQVELNRATPRPEDDEFEDLVPRCATLDGFADKAGRSSGVAIESLHPGSALTVDTRNSRYRMVVLNGDERRVMITGGALFQEPTEVRVAGATAGGCSLRIGWIGEGLRMELFTDFGPVTTSPVESIAREDETRLA